MSRGKRADLVVHGDGPFNAEPPRAALAAESVTSLDALYVRNHGPVCELDPSAWRLRVDGLVEPELELSLAELRSRFTRHEVAATLQCAGDRRAGFLSFRDIPGEAPWGPGATGTAVWSGVRLTDVLTAAGIHASAEHVAFRGTDVSEEPDPPQAFGASIPRSKATADEVLLAWGMNGEPLPKVHGAPLGERGRGCRPEDRDRRPGVGRRGRSAARERRSPLEPQGLRQQRLGAGQRQRGPSGGCGARTTS